MKQIQFMNTVKFLALVLSCIIIAACTKDITVDLPEAEPLLVVEGSIEIDQPPIILLTRNASFFGSQDLNDLESYFVHDALIHVSNGDQTVELVEFCINQLSQEQQVELAAGLGYAFDDSADVPNICIYTIPDIINWFVTGNGSLLGEEEKTYTLEVMAEGHLLQAATSIPDLKPFDSLAWRPHNEADRDSLALIYLYNTIPSTGGNFIRYKTQRNDEPFYAPISQSVFDDKLFFGSHIGLPLERGQDPNIGIDFDTYGYFWRGDTVTVQFSQIDKATYDFWNTLENDGGDSPFTSPTAVKSNVDGGLGIWAGYATTFGTIVIPDN